MSRTCLVHLALPLLALLASACSSRSPASAAETPASAGAAPMPEAPPELDRSLFARSAQGSISEDTLQEVLARPLALEFPARVGVLPIIEAEDWRGPSPSYDMVTPGMSAFAKTLPSDDGFAQVTEMIPIPSGALGMEALREIAARYKLRYLMLYREHVDQGKRANGMAAGYATVVGALVLPGSTLEVDGYAEATLLDVKAGVLLFTVRHRLEDSRRSTVWQRDRKLNVMRETLALGAANALAKETRTALAQLRALSESGDAPAFPDAASVPSAHQTRGASQ